MSEHYEITENFKEIKVGRTIKLTSVNHQEVINIAVGVVKAISKDDGGHVIVTFSDFIDTRHREGVLKTHTLTWYEGDICDDYYNGEWTIKTSVSLGKDSDYKDVAKELAKLNKIWINLYEDRLAVSKKNVSEYTQHLRNEKKQLEKLSERFGI